MIQSPKLSKHQHTAEFVQLFLGESQGGKLQLVNLVDFNALEEISEKTFGLFHFHFDVGHTFLEVVAPFVSLGKVGRRWIVGFQLLQKLQLLAQDLDQIGVIWNGNGCCTKMLSAHLICSELIPSFNLKEI